MERFFVFKLKDPEVKGTMFFVVDRFLQIKMQKFDDTIECAICVCRDFIAAKIVANSLNAQLTDLKSMLKLIGIGMVEINLDIGESYSEEAVDEATEKATAEIIEAIKRGNNGYLDS